MNALLLVAGFALVLAFVWVIVTINNFARLRNLIAESWSNVDVALKRRHDLIPNLVKVVERFAQHERDVLERLVELRNRLEVDSLDLRSLGRGETELSSLLGNVVATAEAYPELKSSAHFLDLQKELANTEDRIAAARRFYNGNVRDYRIAVQSFPASLLAGDPVLPEFFEIEFSERLHPMSST